MRVSLPLENGVLLREHIAEDAEPLRAIEYDPEVKKYLEVPQKDPAVWLASFRSDIGRHSSFALVALPERVLAGRASLSCCVPKFEDRELSIVIGKAFWGRGLGDIAAQMLLREARRLNTRNIVACVHPDNFASLALLSRLRFAFLEVLSGAGYAKWQQGHHRYVRAAGA